MKMMSGLLTTCSAGSERTQLNSDLYDTNEAFSLASCPVSSPSFGSSAPRGPTRADRHYSRWLSEVHGTSGSRDGGSAGRISDLASRVRRIGREVECLRIGLSDESASRLRATVRRLLRVRFGRSVSKQFAL